MDQGEHLFRFWIKGGAVEERLTHIDREALVHNEEPFALCVSPSGHGRKPAAGIVVSDAAIQVTAIKQAEDGRDWIIRLFEPTGRGRTTHLLLPLAKVHKKLSLSPFEIKTLRLDRRTAALTEVDLLERPEVRRPNA
jgi:alpha-mannosidase